MATIFHAGRFTLNLHETKIMGVLNCTPDSFSDGGQFITPDLAIARARQMVAEGADIIDIGAESTRPGSLAISVDEELERLMPVVVRLVADGGVPISIDTKKAAVMRAMLDAGVDMINDVHGFEDKDALQVVADSNCGLCIMHMRGMPENMQANTDYTNVVAEVSHYLTERIKQAEKVGIARERIVVDPGFGFGKTPEHNMLLIKHIAECVAGIPKLIGVSRKSTIGYYLDGAPVAKRLYGSVALATLGAWLGASIVRVHDVAATKDALRMVTIMQKI